MLRDGSGQKFPETCRSRATTELRSRSGSENDKIEKYTHTLMTHRVTASQGLSPSAKSGFTQGRPGLVGSRLITHRNLHETLFLDRNRHSFTSQRFPRIWTFETNTST